MLVLRALVPLALLQQEVDLVKLASRILVLCETRCVSLLAMKLMLSLGLPLPLQDE